MEKNRTMAFQISEELFQRIKEHLNRESARTGKKLTQRQFVLGLVERELTHAEAEVEAETPEGRIEVRRNGRSARMAYPPQEYNILTLTADK